MHPQFTSAIRDMCSMVKDIVNSATISVSSEAMRANSAEDQRKTQSFTRARSQPEDLASFSSDTGHSRSRYNDKDGWEASSKAGSSFASLLDSIKPPRKRFEVRRCMRTHGDPERVDTIKLVTPMYIWTDPSENKIYFQRQANSAPNEITVASAALHFAKDLESVLLISSDKVPSEDYVFWLCEGVKARDISEDSEFDVVDLDSFDARNHAENKYKVQAGSAAKKHVDSLSDVFDGQGSRGGEEEGDDEVDYAFQRRLRDGPAAPPTLGKSGLARRKKQAAKSQQGIQSSMNQFASREVDLTRDDHPDYGPRDCDQPFKGMLKTNGRKSDDDDDHVPERAFKPLEIERYRPAASGTSPNKRVALGTASSVDDFDFDPPRRLTRPTSLVKAEAFEAKPRESSSLYSALATSTQAKREKLTSVKGPNASRASVVSDLDSSAPSSSVKKSHHFAGKSPSPPRVRAHEEISLLEDAEDDIEARALKRRSEEEAERASAILCTYPPGKVDSVTITAGDLSKLAKEDAFINDSLLDFYLKHIQAKLDAKMSGRIHIFTSYLYSKLVQCLEKGPPKRVLNTLPDKTANESHRWLFAYTQVWRWTAGLNLLDCDCIIFPINQGLHWSLAVCCFKQRAASSSNEEDKHPPSEGVLMTLDSLKPSVHDHAKIARVIRRYLDHVSMFRTLKMEPKARNVKEKDELSEEEEDDDDFVPQVVDASEAAPQSQAPVEDMYDTEVPRIFTEQTLRSEAVDVSLQTDGVNCGLHLLNNAEMIVELLAHTYFDGLEDLNEFEGTVRGLFSGKPFHTSNANAKRREIRDLVDAEVARQAERKSRKGRATTSAVVAPATVVTNVLTGGGFIANEPQAESQEAGLEAEAEDVEDDDDASLEGHVLPMPAQDTLSQSLEDAHKVATFPTTSAAENSTLAAPATQEDASQVQSDEASSEEQDQGIVEGVS